jgi:hypothetical protein
MILGPLQEFLALLRGMLLLQLLFSCAFCASVFCKNTFTARSKLTYSTKFQAVRGCCEIRSLPVVGVDKQ